MQRVRGAKNETVKSAVLDAVNAQLKAGTLAIDEAPEAVERELARLRKLQGTGKTVTLAPANLRLMKRY